MSTIIIICIARVAYNQYSHLRDYISSDIHKFKTTFVHYKLHSYTIKYNRISYNTNYIRAQQNLLHSYKT